MHLPEITGVLRGLTHPGKIWERHRLRSRIKMFLDGLPKWHGALHLRFAGRGSHSMAYSFVLRGKEYVIRISGDIPAFTRDAFASRYADSFPVPRVFAMGEFEKNRYFAISERLAGRQIRRLNMRSALRVAPLMFEALERIHLADISGAQGYGVVDAAGNGISPSWKDFLLHYDRYRNSQQWDREMSGTILDHRLYDHCLDRMASFIPFCPEERSLVHGDFTFSNVLSDGERITGIIDWQYCSIGDALFDFANCYFWYYNKPYGRVWLEMIVQKQRGLLHFDERLRCYMLKSAAGALINAVLAGNIESYKGRTVTVNHLLGILDKPIEAWHNHR